MLKRKQASTDIAETASPPLFSRRDLLKIILPLIAQQILTIMIGTADSMMVAYAGEAAVSGVSLVNTLDTLLVLVFTSLVAGGSVVISQALGRKDLEGARAASKQLLYTTAIIATLLTTTVLLLRRPLLSLLFGTVEADVMYSAESYFFFVALSFPFLAIESSVGASFRSIGNSMISLLVSMMNNVLNLTGNALLIYVFHLGAAGAAIATLISRTVGAIVMVILLHNKKHVVYLERLFHYRPDFKVIKSILRIGVPNGIENGMFQFGKLLTQTLISTMPTAAISANAVATTLANIQYMTGSAFQSTMVTVVGRCIGAKEEKQAKHYSRLLLGLNYLALFLVALVTMIFARPLIAAFDVSAASSSLAYQLILYHSICAVVMWPIAFTLPSAFRAASDVRFPLVVSMFSMWTFRVALSYYFAPESFVLFRMIPITGLGMGVMGVWVAMTIDWVFRFILYIWRYFSGAWLRVRRD